MKKRNLKRDFIFVLSILFMAMGVGFLAVQFRNMGQSFRKGNLNIASSSAAYWQNYVTSYVNSDFVIADMMGKSPTLRRWLKTDSDADRLMAFEEMSAYSDYMGENTVTFAVDEDSKTFYVDGNLVSTINSTNPDDIWYFDTLRQDSANFNLDHNSELNKFLLWVNVPVKENGRNLGVVGAGIELEIFSSFISESEKNVFFAIDDNKVTPGQKPLTMYFIDANGVIQNASDQTLKGKKITDSVLSESAISVFESAFAEVKNNKQIAARIFDNKTDYFGLSVVHIPQIDWYLVSQTYNGTLMSIGEFVRLVLVYFLMVFVIVLEVLVVFNMRIDKPLSMVKSSLELMSNGYLKTESNKTIKIVNDEIGMMMGAFFAMENKITEIISAVEINSHEIKVASTHIAKENQALAQRAEEQAAMIEQTGSALTEMASRITETTRHASEGNKIMKACLDYSVESESSIRETASNIDLALVASEKINQITKMIEDIAFQTNLLALNAAVEAARAGDQGRGFAVVASEVRNLAQNASAFAKEINVLILDSKSKIDAATFASKNSLEKFSNIRQQLENAAGFIEQITDSTKVEMFAISEMSRSFMEMDSVTQKNAALAETTQAISQTLSEQAEDLHNLVSFFKIDRSNQG